jgi:hypothetical protein
MTPPIGRIAELASIAKGAARDPTADIVFARRRRGERSAMNLDREGG